jgi:hypothetical protein
MAIIFLVFYYYRSLRKVLYTTSAISQALDDIPSGSDLSDIDSDSGDDETYQPKVAEDIFSSDDGEPDDADKGLLGEVGGVARDDEDETLPDIDGAEPLVRPVEAPEDVAAAGPTRPTPKRRRLARERPHRVWTQEDLPQQEMPESTVKPKGLEDCDTDASVFLKMFWAGNISLLTTQSNLVRVASTIERNKLADAISEKEIKQVPGILMYMSIVTLPNTKMY